MRWFHFAAEWLFTSVPGEETKELIALPGEDGGPTYVLGDGTTGHLGTEIYSLGEGQDDAYPYKGAQPAFTGLWRRDRDLHEQRAARAAEINGGRVAQSASRARTHASLPKSLRYRNRRSGYEARMVWRRCRGRPKDILAKVTASGEKS